MERTRARDVINFRQEAHEITVEENRIRRQLSILESSKAYSVMSRIYDEIIDSDREVRLGVRIWTPRGERITQRIDDIKLAKYAEVFRAKGISAASLDLRYNFSEIVDRETGEPSSYHMISVVPAHDNGVTVQQGIVNTSGPQSRFVVSFERPVPRGEGLSFSTARIIQEYYKNNPAR